MTCILEKKVNKTSEWKLKYDIINPSKHTKISNIHCSPILHQCMNTWKGKAKFKNFRILLDSGWSSTTVMGNIILVFTPKEDAVMKRHIQMGSITRF